MTRLRTVPTATRSRPWGLSAYQVLDYYGWTVTDSDCWEWSGPRHKQGYGSIEVDGKGLRVTRVAYQRWVESPGDKQVLHTCDNPPCINPTHLFLGTQADNNKDMFAKGRANPGGHRK